MPTSFTRVILIALLGVELIQCSPHSRPDAGPDSGAGGGTLGGQGGGFTGGGGGGGAEDAGQAVELPQVTPAGIQCDGAQPNARAACIPSGWFNFARWSNGKYRTGDGESLRKAHLQPIYLDAFMLDVTEVSNAAYLDAGMSVPSDCGYENIVGLIDEMLPSYLVEHSGWNDDGGFPPDRAPHPVVCVTRAEAERYCAQRSGRLANTLELMRAGIGAFPSERPYPWGESPPQSQALYADLPANLTDYAIYESNNRQALSTAPVFSALMGRTDEGIVGLSGNVSELSRDCWDDVELTIPSKFEYLIRPAFPAFNSFCLRGVVVVGSNWATMAYGPFTVSQTIFVLNRSRPDDDSIRAPEGFPGLSVTLEEKTWGWSRPLDGGAADANERRSWRIGFRCAYDLQPRP